MQMTHRLDLTAAGAAPDTPRIGGGALIGGVADWPQGPFGHPLVLVASLPAAFLAVVAGIDIGVGRVASVFSTYHGDPSELALLRRGTTQVLVHAHGDLVHGAVEVPAHRIDAGEAASERSVDWHEDDIPNSESLVGGEARSLQEEELTVDGLAFALQFYGGDLSEPSRNLFYLADGVGYLFLPTQAAAGVDRSGLFFVQVT